MKRSVWFWTAALIVVAALEFGLLGASSAGASFVPSWLASSKSAPPQEHQYKPPCRGDGCTPPPVSPPPCLPDRRHENDHACDLQPASIQLTPDPLTIQCDGVDHSTLTVRITDDKGEPVPDGTMVYFSASDGTTSPSASPTRRGVATTSVVFYGELFKSGPNVTVDVDALEAGVRIRCFPNSNSQPSCPLSPPSSPPCLPLPPSSPPPCSFTTSPPSVSPPCPTPSPSPTPFPTATPVPGGVISFGAPALANGVLTVPILTTASTRAFNGFAMDLAFDASEVSPSSTSAGSVIQSLGLGMFCYQSPSPAIVTVTWGCTVLGMASTTSAGELAVAEFALKGNTGCARFHIVTYGPPDGGDLITGSYTIDAATPGAQQNTYGGDITVNLADGSVGCAAPPLTVTPTETPFPSVKATNTPLPTDTPTPIGTEGVAAKDVALVIDRSGSMADAPCTGPNDQSGCKIHEAKSAANSFIDQLIARSGFTKVGYAPFAGCYNPPLSNALCVPAPAPSNVLTSVNCNSPGASLVACLFADPTTAHNLINATQPNGGTNLCSGLSEGLKILRGPGNQLANPTTKDVVVLLTDGDNEYDASTSTGLDAACVPTGALGNDLCNSVRSGANRSLDLKTHQIARAMKANNTEIFIIQMYSDSCAPPDAIYSASDCNSNVGNADPPLVASPRLLQCMASSSPGTNDHYFKTNDATTLTSIMQVIAGMIKS